MRTSTTIPDTWRSWSLQEKQVLAARLEELLEKRKQAGTLGGAIPTDWRAWLLQHFPQYVGGGFAPRHVRMWEWLTALQCGVKPRAEVEIWPRGGAKSTSAELGCGWICERRTRRFALYVSGTQEQADKHVAAVATILERRGVSRMLNVYGHSKGWRRQELRAANGFNVAAFGLDTAARGVKLEEARPDLIVFDDVDARHDTDKTVEKKIAAITETILPAGSADCAILWVQNLIHRDSIASRLADGRADFLLDRLPVIVEPAVRGLQYERAELPAGGVRYIITAGEPTWDGQDLATCEAQLNEWGRRAFLREAQHEVAEAEKGLWQRGRDIEPFRVTEIPQLVRVAVALDPSATTMGDDAGIVAGGIDARGHGYLLADATIQGSPHAWARAAVATYHKVRADVMVAEDNNGGEMVAVTIGTVPGAPSVKRIHASRGKLTRAEPVQAQSEAGKIHHVGYFPELEEELCSWEQGDPSPNRLDAYVWLWSELMQLQAATSGYAVNHLVM